MRIFIGIDIPEDLKEEIWEKIEIFRENFKGFRWVRKENFHITLKFIGEVSEERLKRIIERLKDVEVSPFYVNLENFGFFPEIKRPRVFYLCVKDDNENILKIYKEIETRLKKLGIEKEKRKFVPHITLARLKKDEKVFIDEEILKKINFKYKITIKDFTLFESILKKEGAIYRKIANFS